jgi:hypothetical protein
MGSLRFDVIAFVGGDRINILGSATDVLCFFYLIKKFTAPFLNQKEQLIILDRLFKRYLTIEETPVAVNVMKFIQEKFDEIPFSDINWQEFGVDKQPKLFHETTGSLREATNNCFARFYECASSVLYIHNIQNGVFFRPVKLSRSDFGSLYEADKRPLAEYDALDKDALPFWLMDG